MRLAAMPLRATSARSRCARGIILTRYAMCRFEFRKELLGIAPMSVPGLLAALADAFTSIGAGCNVKQSLIGSSILYDSLGLAIHRKHHGPLALFELLHEIPRAAAECGERLNVLGDIEHTASYNY